MTDVERKLMDLLTEQRAQVVREIIAVLEEWAAKRGAGNASPPKVHIEAPKVPRATRLTKAEQDRHDNVILERLYTDRELTTIHLAGFTGIDKRHVSKAVARLIAAGHVEIAGGHGMGLRYRPIGSEPQPGTEEGSSTDGYPMEPEGQES